MEAARHPFPVSSTALHYRRIKSESQAFRDLVVGQSPVRRANRALEGVAHWELLFATETFYSGASATFSPFKASGPFHDLAFFTEPSVSFWNSITKGASVVKKRVSDSG